MGARMTGSLTAVKQSVNWRWMILFITVFVSTSLLYAVFRFVLFYAIGWYDGLNLDWYTVYYPAINYPSDPFSVYGYFNPPWLVWILSPLAMLTAVDSHALWIVIILLLTVRCVYELGGGGLAVFLTIISPGFLITIMNGQIDVLVLLGLLTGSWLLILIKPQVVGLVIVYDIIVNQRIDWTAVFIALISLVIFLLFMSWPDRSGLDTGVSIAPWPYGVPIGFVLFVFSIWKRDKYLAALATFFFAPYMSASSLLVYSAIMTARYGRIPAIVFSVLLWALCIRWFL